MKTEFRNRVFLPVVMPLAIVLLVVGLVVGFAFILLYNTRESALVIALVAAAGILFSIALAASQDRLEGAKKVVVLGVGLLPIVLGGLFAVPAISGVDESLLNINREPHLVVPEDAPLLAAESTEGFCLPTPDGCELTQTWEVSPTQEIEEFAYIFENLDAGVLHNLALYTLAGTEGAPEPGEAVFVPDPFPGVAEQAYLVEEEVPETFYFVCTVHPNMNGVGSIIAAEEAVETEGA